MGTGYRNTVFETHQFCQHLCTGDRWNALPACCNQLRIVPGNGTGIDHHVTVADIFFGMIRHYMDAEILEVARDPALMPVRTRDGITQVVQHLCNTAHTGTTNTNKMDMFYAPQEFFEIICHKRPPGRCQQRHG